jgi:hypothetical protein
MDILADAECNSDSGRHFGGRGGQGNDQNMENNSNEDSLGEQSSSTDYSHDNMGNKVKKIYGNEQEKKAAKQRKMIKKMKTNISQFYKENTIGDLLPYN